VQHAKQGSDRSGVASKAETKEIPGVVAMAASGNEIIYQGAFGKRDLSRTTP